MPEPERRLTSAEDVIADVELGIRVFEPPPGHEGPSLEVARVRIGPDAASKIAEVLRERGLLG